MSELRLRQAARAVVLDDDERILLVRFEFPGRIVWATPGGGIEAAESDEAAIRRELAEEAGLHDYDLGPLVWNRTAIVPFESGLWDGQIERYYLVRTSPFEPRPHLSWEQLRVEHMTGIRWWTLDELEATDALFAPRRLPALVRGLLEDGLPSEPLDVGL